MKTEVYVPVSKHTDTDDRPMVRELAEACRRVTELEQALRAARAATAYERQLRDVAEQRARDAWRVAVRSTLPPRA